MNGSKYLTIALNTPLRRNFDYLPPYNCDLTQLQIGQRVRVPFARRELIGVLLDVTSSTQVLPHKLKQARQILDIEPPLPPDLIKLCKWIASYYQHNIGEVFACAMPTLLNQGEQACAKQAKFWVLAPDFSFDNLSEISITPRQLEILQIFAQHPNGISEKLLQSLFLAKQITKPVLNALMAKNLVMIAYRDNPIMPKPHNLLAEPELLLNDEQRAALDVISENLNSFKVSLLYGVTGSGKTEVYLQLIRYVIASGKQVLVLIPEINLTPQTLARFSSRFNARIVVLHSNLTDRMRLNAWLAARNNEAEIIIGTRSAIFTPLANLGLIIVDEEHDSSYKQQESLRYHARDLACVRAKMANVPLVLGSATPSLESLHNANNGRYQLLQLTQRAGGANLPTMQTLDLKGQHLTAGLAPQLQAAIAQTLALGQQVLVFLNRRGFAQVLLCHDCGYVCECKHCDARLVLHQKRNVLQCHHCDHVELKRSSCPKCGSSQMVALGAGTERVEEALQQMFSDYPVLRVDRDSIKGKDSLEQIFAEVQTGKPCILLGTQMLAKGHHFPMVTLVAVLDIDNGLYSNDFRAIEKTAQMILQVAGRAGRASNAGTVLIQTHLPNHPLLQQLISSGYLSFAEKTLSTRKDANLPPFSFMVMLRSSSVLIEPATVFLERSAEYAEIELMRLKLEDVELLGPIAAPMAYRAGRYRMQLLLQSNSRTNLHKLLQVLIPIISNLPEARKVRWSVDVDPVDLF